MYLLPETALTSKRACLLTLVGGLFRYVDFNCFYAKVECLYRPEIRNKPVAVGGDESQRHGIVRQLDRRLRHWQPNRHRSLQACAERPYPAIQACRGFDPSFGSGYPNRSQHEPERHTLRQRRHQVLFQHNQAGDDLSGALRDQSAGTSRHFRIY